MYVEERCKEDNPGKSQADLADCKIRSLIKMHERTAADIDDLKMNIYVLLAKIEKLEADAAKTK